MAVSGSEQKAVGDLLKNMRKALDFYSISELNEAILKALNETSDGKRQEVDATFKVVCDHFSLKRNVLIRTKYKNSIPKSLIYQLLHFTFNLPIRHIAFKIFSFKDQSSVALAVRDFKKLDMNLKQDREHKEIFDKLQSDIIQLVANERIQ